MDPTRIDLSIDPTERRLRGTTVHGNKYFDVPYMSEVHPGLWVGGCTSGLVLPENITHLISLYPWEQYTIRHQMRSVLGVWMYDDPGQSLDQVNALATWVLSCATTGETLVHCQAGLNRSNVVAARALMLTGISADTAIQIMRDRRSPASLCNEAFEDWLRGQD